MRWAKAALFAAALVPAVFALFRVDWFDAHEGASYPARVVEVTRCWQDGMWSARWFPDLSGGRGDLFLSFYAPLLFWLAAALHVVGLPVAAALKLLVVLATLLGALGVYRLARAATGVEGATAAAVLWTYAPYRLRDLWTRGDLAELLALAALPWALAATLDAVRRPGALPALRAGFFGALSIVSHNVTGLWTGMAMALAVACGLAFAEREAGRVRQWGAALFAGACALLLSAFFWVPALAERGWVHLERLRSGSFLVEGNFVSLRSLVAVSRPERVFVEGRPEPMTFELGVAVFLAPLAIFALRDARARAHVALGAALLVGGALLATRLATPVYRAIPLIAYGGLPWRTLGVASLGAGLLAGIGVGALVAARARAVRWAALAIVTVSAILTVPDLLRPLREIQLTEPMLDPAVYRTMTFTSSVTNEYVPVWSVAKEAIPFQDGLAAAGPATFSNVRRGVARWTFDVDAGRVVPIVFQDFFYPGWTVWVDGDEVEAYPRPGSGHLEIRVPAGRHHVSAVLRASPTRRLAALTSAATALGALAVLATRRRLG